MLLAILTIFAVLVLALVLACAVAIIWCKIESKAFELYEKWAQDELLDRDKLWEIIRATNRRLKTFKRILKKERLRHRLAEAEIDAAGVSVVRSYLKLRAQFRELSDNHAALVEEVMGTLLERSYVDVSVSRLRRQIEKEQK